MNSMDQITQYISKTNLPKNQTKYQMSLEEMDVFFQNWQRDWFQTLIRLFEYGQAKGYRMAKAEVRK